MLYYEAFPPFLLFFIFLHFSELGIDWIQHAIEKLEPLCKASNADLYIFLSMMYAMQKHNTKCKMAFKFFESLERFVDEVMFDLETNNHSY